MFGLAEDALDEQVHVAVGDPFLDIATEPSFRRKRDQAMLTAVTDVEADGSRHSIHQCDRLAMLSGLERKLLVFTAEPVTENGAKSGTA